MWYVNSTLAVRFVVEQDDLKYIQIFTLIISKCIIVKYITMHKHIRYLNNMALFI